MPKDSNPETRAIDLDMGSVLGKDLASVREIVDRENVRLIAPTDGVPDGWPPEIHEVGPWDDGPEDKLDWSHVQWTYQDADAEWGGFYGYVRPDPVAEWDFLPCCIYTRDPKATPEALVRPIAFVNFDEDGVCTRAQAAAAEIVFRTTRGEWFFFPRGEQKGP